MIFETPLIRGSLVRRYKRFLADVVLDTSESVTAHCANSGSMLSVNDPGSEVWLSPANNPARKLKYTWELVRVGDALVGINTQHPNRIVAEAITEGAIPELAGYATLRREVRYGTNSRVDILLEDGPAPPCYVEVKNVTLMRTPGLAEFPDAVTARGAKHLDELAREVAAGNRAAMVFLVQRPDCERFTPAADLDPTYASALARVRDAGVETICVDCAVSNAEIRVRRPLPLDIPAPKGVV